MRVRCFWRSAGALCSLSLIAHAQPSQPPIRLQLHKPIERELKPGESDRFVIELPAGQFVHVVAEQKGVDLVLSIIDPEGKVLVTADRPNGTFGPEAASAIAERSGEYQIRVAGSAGSGHYRIEWTDSREPSEADRKRILAEQTFFSAIGGSSGRRNLPELERAASLWHELSDRYEEAMCLKVIGSAYGDTGERQKALEYYNRALLLFRAVGDRSQEAATVDDIGAVYYALGEKQRALESFVQALPPVRAVGDRAHEATTLIFIGASYYTLGEAQKALEYFGQALPIQRDLGDRFGEARTLDNIGRLYAGLGEKRKALEYCGQALRLNRAIRDRAGETAALINIGAVYNALGEQQKALEYYSQALPLYRALGDPAGEAIALNNIGVVYYELGEKQKALEYYSQSLPLRRTVGDRAGEATTLNNIGGVYADLGETRKALEYYSQALPLRRTVGDRAGESTSLNNIGMVYKDLGEKQKALEYYGQALALSQALGDRSGEATTLNNIGGAYYDLGDMQKAVEYYSRTLPLVRAVGDRSGEASTLHNISLAFKQRPDAAIWFGKLAINVLQSIRRDNQKLPEELKRSYSRSVESTYRDLAGLLVGQQRFGEAEEILDLLKNKETSDFVKRDAVTDQLRPATLLENERKALERYEQIVGQVVTLGQQKAALIAKRDESGLSPDEVEQLGRLESDLTASNRVVLTFLNEQEKTFAPGSKLAKQTNDETAGVQKALQKLGPDVVAIYTLVMPDQYVALLVTGGARKAYVTKIKEGDLNQKIFEFRQLLQNPSSNPLPLAQALYRVVFPEGLRQDLDAMKARTIMWSIDSTLRYVPIAALHDGNEYLVQRFRNSLITPASLTRLTEASGKVWTGTGFGVSEAKASFAALPSVPEELRGIFRQNEAESAPIAGTIRLNAAFTRTSFENDLHARRNSVVHIATHFDSRPGVAANSHLLLGDGTELSLADVEDEQDLFDGVDLLTLSACSTAFTNRAEDGREVDSFGTIAQRLGAKAVIASLWSVNDEATARLMETMYRLRQNQPDLGKSEALRQAQEEMATGVMKPSSAATEDRGVQSALKRTAAKDWSHPYYWAPFILIGNWK